MNPSPSPSQHPSATGTIMPASLPCLLRFSANRSHGGPSGISHALRRASRSHPADVDPLLLRPLLDPRGQPEQPRASVSAGGPFRECAIAWPGPDRLSDGGLEHSTCRGILSVRSGSWLDERNVSPRRGFPDQEKGRVQTGASSRRAIAGAAPTCGFGSFREPLTRRSMASRSLSS